MGDFIKLGLFECPDGCLVFCTHVLHFDLYLVIKSNDGEYCTIHGYVLQLAQRHTCLHTGTHRVSNTGVTHNGRHHMN